MREILIAAAECCDAATGLEKEQVTAFFVQAGAYVSDAEEFAQINDDSELRFSGLDRYGSAFRFAVCEKRDRVSEDGWRGACIA